MVEVGGVLRGNRLTDLQGREWRHSRWLSLKDAQRFFRRGGPVAVYDADEEPIEWWGGAEVQALWEKIRHHIEASDGWLPRNPDDLNFQVHLWAQDEQRLLGVRIIC